ncbi:GDSL-type esterase/lipase family protein [Subsaxibacter sp. CAU 1640]|uniref:GDSL-type esterase/lipase family protein n=1 Tax=Subsaxibacter sp. CAU 1640 TaxID=2933271 RepID=UPI0020030DD2|nr:GDSL-type esterase/lipase family protein [Subsaxibacter sp. CAU 1640]MCK7590580.1 GDSL-type esterase/lipase family protein [Subsaxibacter sp. CAU 1640]
MNYSPFKICLYIVLTLLVLLGVMYLSNAKQLDSGKVQEGFFVGDVTIKYPTAESFLEQGKREKADIKALDSIVENIEVLVEDIDVKQEPFKEENFVPKIPDLTKIDTSKVQRINYPVGQTDYIAQLRQHLKSGQCRIIHYGDSQLEGDRISAYLRNRLQGLYGGSGPGFAPIVQVYDNISSVVNHSDNWTRHAYFDPTQTKFPHKKYGAYSSMSRFTPAYETVDSLLLDSLSTTKATISIGIPTKSYALLKKFNKIGLHYGNAVAPTSIKVYNDGALIKSQSLIADGNYHKFAIELGATPSNLSIELEGKISPDFYGLTLDGNSGVSLDNVAMRGSSGTIFAGTNGTNFQQMYQQLQPKLLIFQYGGNSVPYIKDSTGVAEYAGYLKNHITWVKRKTNNANVIFIGPSDMTTLENGEMITYPLLPYLNETLKKVCLENGIAFWSMFDAMGGKSSMKHWVDEGLAANDYTHFSPKGTKIISELFFLALYLDLSDIK